MKPEFRAFLSLLALIGWAQSQRFYGRPDEGNIRFPLRNVHHSINEHEFTYTQQNLTVGKCEEVSDRRIILNLENLGIYPPPNPYPGFIDGPSVSCLNLANNGITQVATQSFDLLSDLRYLSLSRNRIQLCDFFNFGHPQLATLVIEDNSSPMDNIKRTIGKAECFPRLRYLYLRRDGIRGLDFSLKQAFPGLTHLFLSDNHLDSANFVRDPPNSLSHLYLERNRISGLDCKILKSLEALHLCGNQIRTICYRKCSDTSLRLEGVHKLSVLAVSDNRIYEIEGCAFQDARGLTVINLAKNQLGEIKKETFEKLSILKELNLDDNQLREVPNLRNNHQLTSVSIRRNKLEKIRLEDFMGLKALKCLYLGGNQIHSVDNGALEDLESLTDLDLSYNVLDSLPSGWKRSQWKLRTLDVRGNRFQTLESMSLGSAPNLNAIYMQNNPVVHISGLVMSKLAGNVVVHLKNDCLKQNIIANECYSKCNGLVKNETYSRWVNGY